MHWSDTRSALDGSTATALINEGAHTQDGGSRLLDEITETFPPVAERSTLLLYDIDPDELQAQWQLTLADLAAGRSAFPSGQAPGARVLKLVRRTGQGDSELLERVYNPGAEDFGIVRLPAPAIGGEVYAELGLESADGGWLLLSRSNALALSPRALRTAPVETPLAKARFTAPAMVKIDSALAATAPSLEPVFPQTGVARRTPSPLAPAGFSETQMPFAFARMPETETDWVVESNQLESVARDGEPTPVGQLSEDDVHTTRHAQRPRLEQNAYPMRIASPPLTADASQHPASHVQPSEVAARIYPLPLRAVSDAADARQTGLAVHYDKTLAATGQTLVHAFPLPVRGLLTPGLEPSASATKRGGIERTLRAMPPPLLPSHLAPLAQGSRFGPTSPVSRPRSSPSARRPDRIHAELFVCGWGTPDETLVMFDQTVTFDEDGYFALRRPVLDPFALFDACKHLMGPARAQDF